MLRMLGSMTTPQTDATISVYRTGVPRRFEVRSGTATLTTLPARTARRGGPVELEGQWFHLERTGLAPTYRLSSPDGHPVALAARTGLRGWDIEVSGGRLLRLNRTSLGSDEVLLDDAGREVGEFRRITHGIEADLPGFDRPTQVFVLVVALAARQRRRRAVLLGR